MACSMRQLLCPTLSSSYPQHSSSLAPPPCLPFFATTVGERKSTFLKLPEFYSHRNLIFVAKVSSGNEGIVSPNDDPENGVSLGTMKLPVDTDLQRFESLLFQWANSLCQGANLPLPVPLKVDKIAGGARLGFITVGDGKTEVLVYIDCLVFPASNGFPPMFRAIRNGPLKGNPPPGEPRIMRSLLQALQKSIEIARL